LLVLRHQLVVLERQQRCRSSLREGRHYSCRVSGGCSVVLMDEAANAVAATDLADGHWV
jgi:hypothetical protein